MSCRVEHRADLSAAMEVFSNPNCTVSVASNATLVVEGGNYFADAYDLVATVSCKVGCIHFDGQADELTVRVAVDGGSIDTGQGRNACDPITLLPGTALGVQPINVIWEFVEPEAEDRTGLNPLPNKSIDVVIA
jgi:hypothetical protein